VKLVARLTILYLCRYLAHENVGRYVRGLRLLQAIFDSVADEWHENSAVCTDTQAHTLQDWPGSQLFFRDGHFVISQKWPGALGTVGLVVAIEAAFMALVAVKLEQPLNLIAFLTGCVPPIQ
jgi:hypothetical protein